MCWEFAMIAALPSPSINASEDTEMLPETLKDKQKILKSAATVQEQAYFFDRFDTLLENEGFFTAQEKAPTVKRNMRNFFIKARFTKQELLTWHGILTLFDKQK
jgi:tRNA C32,U32 (ribose-2'-O)-methylase TrmJ